MATITLKLLLCFYFIDFITGSFADSLFVKTCAPAKCPDGDKFAYETGYSYFYNYEANVVTTISGDTEDFTSIFIEAQTEIHAFTPCDFSIKLRNVNLRSRDVHNPVPNDFAPGHQQFKEALEKWTLRFSFQDGAIDDLCAEPAEEPWVLNIKRAIISMLQNRANANSIGSTQLMERDIQGNCPTEYVLDFHWMTMSATKTKDLDKCNERSIFLSAVQSSPYLSPKGSNINSVLRSTYKCVQDFDERVIRRVSCDERHILRPFSNGDSGAMTMTKQSLVLMDDIHRPIMHKEKGSSEVLTKTTLLFDHDFGPNLVKNQNAKDALHQAELALFQLCRTSKEDISSDTPRHFWRLVKSFQLLSYSQLTEMMKNADRICEYSNKGRKYVRDALPLIGNPQSINLMKDLIVDGTLLDFEINSWLDQLAFHPQPTKQTLTSVMHLIKLPTVKSTGKHKAILSISAFTNSYCHNNPICEETEEVQTLIDHIKQQLGKDCNPRNSEETENIVVALKALGNLGRWNSYDILEKCAMTDHPTIVRIAAVEAYRRLPCDVQREYLLSIFASIDEDSEIRIAAYLGVMRCPVHSNFDSIWKSLNAEVINQVNSFVWSHLSSIKESVDPCKIELRAILEDTELKAKYAKDLRKFSKAFEKSVFSETLNGGGHLETHLIYSPTSFIPRSAMLNLTVDLFGQSINLVEISGHIKGFDHLAESFFRHEPHSEVKIDSTGDTDKLQHLPVDTRIQQITKTVRSTLKTLSSPPPDGTLSMKVFGQEVWYNHIKSEQIESLVQHWSHGTYAEFLHYLAKDNSIEISKNAILMDSSFVVPTIAGLPLVLSLNVTANANLKMGGRLDIRKFSHGIFEIDGQIRPSAGISVMGSMIMDGYVGKSGVQIDADIYTSIQVDGKFVVNDRGHVKVHYNLLRDKMDFLQAKSKLILNHWGTLRPLRSNHFDSTDVTRCSTAATSKPLGVEFCAEFKYANASRKSNSPYFPLTGPSNIAFWMRKTDAMLSTYHFEYVKDRGHLVGPPNVGPRSFILSFRTPRASVDREWTVDYRDNPKNKSMHLSLLTPYKKAIIKGHYDNDVTRKGLYADVIIDGDQEFSFHSEIRIENKTDHMKYLPKIIIRVPSQIIFSLEGFFHYSASHCLAADITIQDFTIKPIIFRGELTKENEESGNIHYNGMLKSPMLDATVKGSLNRTAVGLISRTNFEYHLDSHPKKETVDLTMKMKYTTPSSRSLTIASATVDIHTSILPEYNSIVIWNFQLADGHVENTVRVDSTGNGRKAQLAHFQQILTYRGTLDEHILNGTFLVKIPSKNVHFVFAVDHKNEVRMLLSKINLQRNLHQKYGLELYVQDESDLLWCVKGHAMVNINDQKNGISLDVTEQLPREYSVHFVSLNRPLGNLDISLDYKNHNSEVAMDQGIWVNATGDLEFYGEGSIFIMEDHGRVKANWFVRGDQYQLEGNYKQIKPKDYEGEFSFQNPAHNIDGFVKLNLGKEKVLDFDVRSTSGRRVVGVGRLKLFYDIFEFSTTLSWDADRDPTQLIILNVIDERGIQYGHTTFKLIYLDRIIGIEFDHMHNGSLFSELYGQETAILVEWTGAKKLGVDLDLNLMSVRGRRQMSGGLDVLTPLSAMESLVVNMSHHDDGLSWTSVGSLVVNKHSPFRAISQGKYWRSGNQQYMEAAINITTPVEGFKNIMINLEHDLASREIESILKMQWAADQQVKLHAYAIKPDSKFDKAAIQLNVTTPFITFRSLNFIMDHNLKSSRINSLLRFLWNEEEKVFVVLNGDSGMHGSSYKIWGNAIVITPLDGFRNFSMDLSHSYDIYGFKTQLQGFLPSGNQVMLGGEGTLQRSAQAILLNGSFDVISSLISFGTGILYSRMGHEIKCALRGNWNDTFANVSASGVYISLTDFELDATIITPVKGLENAVVIVMNHVHPNSVMTKLSGKRDDSESGLILSGQWNFDAQKSLNLDLLFRLDSPLAVLPHIQLLATHGRMGSSLFRTNLQGTWNELKSYLDHSLTLHDKFNFKDNLTLSLPFDNLEHVQLTVNQSWAHGFIINELELQVLHDKLLRTSIDVKHSTTDDGKRKIDALLKLDSSIWMPNQMEIVLDHVDNGMEYHPKIIFQTMQPKTRVLQLTSYLRSFPGSKIWHLTATTQIPNYEHMALAGMYRLSDTNLNFNLSTQWSKSSKLEVDGEIGIDFLAPRLRLNIATPNEGYKTFKLDGHYNVWAPEKHASFFVQKETWRLNLAGSGTFEPDAFVAGLVVETPTSFIGTINLNISGAWKKSGIRGTKVTLMWDNKKIISVAIGLQPYKNSLTTITTSVITPLQWLRNADGVIKISKEPNSRLMFEISARWNRVDIVDATFYLGQDPQTILDIVASLKSTTLSVPYISVVLFAKSVPNLLNASAYIEYVYRGKALKIQSEIKTQGKRTDALMYMETPFSEFPKSSFSGNFRHKKTHNYDVSMVMQLPFAGMERITAEGALKSLRGSVSRGDLRISMPSQSSSLTVQFETNITGFAIRATANPAITKWDLMTVDASYQASKPNTYMVIASATTKSERHEVSGKLQRHLSEILMNGQVLSPLLGTSKPMDGELHIIVQENLAISTNLVVKEEGVAKHFLALDLAAREPTSALFAFAGSTPLLSNGKEYNITVGVSETPVGLSASSSLVLPSGQYFAKTTYERDASNGLVAFLIDAGSPIKDLRHLKIHARKTGDEWDNVAVNLDILSPIEGYDKFSTTISTKHVLDKFFDFSVYIDTPFEGYEKISFEELLTYTLNLTSVSSGSNFTFDGTITTFDLWYSRMDMSMDTGVGAKWQPVSVTEALDAMTAKDGGQFSFKFYCLSAKKSTQDCVTDFLLKGTLWEGEGSWNYSEWRLFNGRMFIDTPFENVDKVGVEATNNIPAGKGTMDSHLALYWAGERVADLKVQGTALENASKQGSLNITTSFFIVQQVDGQAFVLRDQSGIVGSFDIDVNKQTLLNGNVKLISALQNTWNNRTITIELENPWQPFGLAVLSRRNTNKLSVDSSIVWDLVERQANSLRAIIDVFYEESGRKAHVSVIHPKHQVNLVTMYQKLPSNFTHATTLGWGKSKSTLAAYKIWLHTRPQGRSIVRKDIGLRWEHPGRVVLCTADILRKPKFLQMIMDLKWDALKNQQKHIRLNMDYEDTSNQLGKSHKLKVVLHHPKLSRDVEMNSDVMLGHGSDLFKGRLNLQYSPHPRDKLIFNTMLRRFSSNSSGLDGFTLTLNGKHPVSNLNIELNSEWQKSIKIAMTNTTVVYINKDGQRVKFALEGLGNFVSETATIQVDSPKSRFVFEMQHPDPNNYTLAIAKGSHDVPSHATKLYYRPNNHYIEVNATSVKDVGDFVRFVVGFKSLREYTFQILHGLRDKEVRDISIFLHLNTTHYMTARAYWVPDFVDHVQVAVGNFLSGIHNRTIASLWSVWDVFLVESLDKFRLGWQSFAIAVQPMLNELKDETDAVMNDFKHVKEYIAEMYYNNDLLLQDIVIFLETGNGYLSELYEFASESFHWNLEVIYGYIESAWRTLRNVWNSVLVIFTSLTNTWIVQIWEGTLRSFLLAADLVHQLWEKAGTALSALPEIIVNMMTKFHSSETSIMNHFAKLSAVGEKIKEIWDTIKATFTAITCWIKEKIIDEFISWIVNSDLYVFLRAEIIRGTDAIINFVRYRFLELLSKFIESIKLYMSDKHQQIMDDLMVALFNIRDTVWSLPNLIHHPLVTNSIDALLALQSKVIWILQYYELSYPDAFTTVFIWYNDVMNMFTQTAEEASNHFDSPNYVLFLTENGVIEMDQQLPFPWKSLKEGPQIQEMKEIKQFYKLWKLMKSQEMPTPYNAYGPPFMAWYAKVLKTFNYKTWFPPFEGQAILAGRQHFLTLDGRVVEFAGTCSYILMHDFMDENFTITVNYDNYSGGRPVKRSVSLRMDGKEINIHPNFQVFVNGKKVELPHSFGDTAIIREADKTVVRNGYGITATCHWPYDVCSFKVSGWYFGRLAGMLGTYSYEQADDIITPDGRIHQGASPHWANAWTALSTRQCHTAQNFAVEPPRKDPIADGQCLKLFNDSFSLFQYCYEKVDPLPFLNMCLSDVRTRDTPEDVCTSAATYVQACNAKDVSIRMPKLCVKCNLPNGKILQEAGNVTMNSTNKLADVVFIIEAKKCNKDIINIFPDLVSNIDGAMQMASILERRYATVVFGGSGVYDEPHTLTSDSQIFTNHRTISSLGNFNIGRGECDFFDALRFAAKLPFRPGASKNLVALTCSIGDSVEMRRDYPEVHRMLLEDGITVHLLLDREFEVKRSELLFYGIDGVNAYTSKDSRNVLVGDPDLRRQVMPPKDICVPIVLESNGTVFSSMRLYESKKIAKSFLDVYSRRVAQSAQVQVCQTCDCVPDADGVGWTYCQPCVFPRPSHFYMDPSSFFETQYISIYQKYEDGYNDFVIDDKKHLSGDANDYVPPRNSTRNLTRRQHG